MRFKRAALSRGRCRAGPKGPEALLRGQRGQRVSMHLPGASVSTDAPLAAGRWWPAWSGRTPGARGRAPPRHATAVVAMPETHITQDRRRASEALPSGRFDNVCLLSCFVDGETTEAIAAVIVNPPVQDGGEPEYLISPLVVCAHAGTMVRFRGFNPVGVEYAPLPSGAVPRRRGQPPPRTSAMCFRRRATPTAPGTTVSPITKAGVPVIPSFRASPMVSSRWFSITGSRMSRRSRSTSSPRRPAVATTEASVSFASAPITATWKSS